MSVSLSKLEKRTAYTLVLPAVLLVFAIVLFPIFANVWISFKDIELKDIRIPAVSYTHLTLPTTPYV